MRRAPNRHRLPFETYEDRKLTLEQYLDLVVFHCRRPFTRAGFRAFVDFFVSSCTVQMRKPDPDIFRLALEMAQVAPRQVAYIENTPMFVQIAEGLGIRSILHMNYKDTCAKLISLGLPNDKGAFALCPPPGLQSGNLNHDNEHAHARSSS